MRPLPSSDPQTLASAEEAEAYDRWFRAKVQKALDDPRPGIRHEEVMAEMRAIIEAKRCAHASGNLES
jgi:hypothetical protein